MYLCKKAREYVCLIIDLHIQIPICEHRSKLLTSDNGRRYGGCCFLMFPSLYRLWKQSAQDSTRLKIEGVASIFVLALVTNNFLFTIVPLYDMREMVMALVSMA